MDFDNQIDDNPFDDEYELQNEPNPFFSDQQYNDLILDSDNEDKQGLNTYNQNFSVNFLKKEYDPFKG